jgi:hypothetical protein
VDDGIVTVMLRAAKVVFDVFDTVPVAVMQSPAASWPTVSVTTFENWVVPVQLTVVCVCCAAFCTSMLEPLMAATFPLASSGAFAGGAAPTAEAMAVAATRAAAPVPTTVAQRRRRVRRLLFVSIVCASRFLGGAVRVVVEWFARR